MLYKTWRFKMIFEKDKLKKLIEERQIVNQDDYQKLLRDMVKEVTSAIFDGEMTTHLGYEKNVQKKRKNNSRNGYGKKTVNSHFGKIELQPPRDRNGSFEPQLIKKRQKDITGMESKIISMYAKGMSTRDISMHIQDIYGYDISAEMISNITDSVLDAAREWRNRPLEKVYAIVFMDAIIIKQRVEGVVRNIAVYGIIGINLEGEKECLGLYFSETESAKYWLTVMNELKNRGILDVLIFAVDNLSGISDAIQSAFPKAEIQKCIVHQIRNSLKYVSWKERKMVASDLKLIYKAGTEKEGLSNLEIFAQKWDKKYPHISKSWYNNWSELSPFFKYSEEVRRLIYTTNPIESFNRGLRKISKNKAIFPNENSVIKLFYLVTLDISKKWTHMIRDWGRIYSQLCIYFEDRLEEYL